MMSILDVMKREDTLIQQVVLIFVGGGLNTLLMIFSLLEITRNPDVVFSNTGQIPFITTSPELTISYVGIGVIYSIATSLSFTPKRIVSPLYVQITTATILVTIIYANIFINTAPVLTDNFLGGTIAIIMTIYGILSFLGFLQRWIVKKMIGANGTKENMDYQTYSVNAKFDEIRKTITDKQFLYSHNFIQKGKFNDRIILQTRNSSHEKHTMVVVPHPEIQNCSILCITSYVIQYDWLRKPTTTYERESLIGTLQRLLKSPVDSIDVKFDVDSDDKVCTNIALSQSLEVTASPFNKVRNYPKRHVIVISLLLIIGLIIEGLHIYNDKIVSSDTLVNSLVFIIIVFIADIYPTIKERIQSREISNQ